MADSKLHKTIIDDFNKFQPTIDDHIVEFVYQALIAQESFDAKFEGRDEIQIDKTHVLEYLIHGTMLPLNDFDHYFVFYTLCDWYHDLKDTEMRWLISAMVYHGFNIGCHNSPFGNTKYSALIISIGLSKPFTKALLDLPPEYGLDVNFCNSDDDKQYPLLCAIKGAVLSLQDSEIDYDAIRRIIPLTNSQILTRAVQIISENHISRDLIQFENILDWLLECVEIDGSRLALHLPIFENFKFNDCRFLDARQKIINYRNSFPNEISCLVPFLITDIIQIVKNYILGL